MSPERLFRLALLFYPRGYRVQRAEEMLQVLLARQDNGNVWFVLLEAASLVGHGTAERLRLAFRHRHDSALLGLAGTSLLCLLAVLGARQLTATALRALGLDGYPDQWQASVLWVDPRWPVHALWVVTGVALLIGWHRLVVALAWTTSVLHAWLLLEITSMPVLPWPGDAGPHWMAPGGAGEASWVVLSVAGAIMVGGPHSVGRARGQLRGSRWWSAVVVGVVGGGALSVAAMWVAEVSSPGPVALMGGLVGPGLSLLLSAGILARGLIGVQHGRGALVVLGALGSAPLFVRWPTLVTALSATAVVLASGYALAAPGRASRSSPNSRSLPQVDSV